MPSDAAPKVSLSLGGKKKKKPKSQIATSAADFGGPELEVQGEEDYINPDIPKEPLVIPALEDTRKSLQEQARKRRETEANLNEEKQPDDDAAAAAALEQEAAAANNGDGTAPGSSNPNMVIEGQDDTFVRGNQEDKDSQQLQNDLSHLAPELDVQDDTYRKVPISDFGAAMLRGMGWTGKVSTKEEDPSLPRPSRLGLGATPKLLDAPTHGRRPRRQDQVDRDRKLKEQQEAYAREKAQQIKLDKQRTLQIGSIVQIRSSDDEDRYVDGKRAIMRQLQGVPGLNRVLVQLEDDPEPIKVKKGDIYLLDRNELDQQKPFREPPLPKDDKKTSSSDKDRGRDDKRERTEKRRRDDYDRDDDRDRKHRRREDDRRRDRDRDSDRDRDRKRPREERSRNRDRDDRKRERKHRDDDADRDRRSSSWLLPNIRVRVISRKLGDSVYKQKGVVVDVSHKGTATLNMDGSNKVIQCPERYLETALPKVGGNAICLAGNYRYGKGKLLERDSKSSKGVIQLYEDMNVVKLSLDDMAEYCGPLDDDLME